MKKIIENDIRRFLIWAFKKGYDLIRDDTNERGFSVKMAVEDESV